MISVLIKKNNGELNQIVLEGHSNYSNKGSDIYCAAVSAIFQGAINCLDDNCYSISIKDGFGEIKIDGKVSNHDSVVLEVLTRELKDLADQNKKYITYSEEEK